MATLYESIADTDEFHTWVKSFEKNTAFVRPAGSEKGEAIKRPIKEVLIKIQELPVKVKSAEVLKLNVLRACFLASTATPPDIDYAANHRRHLQSFFDELPQAIRAINCVSSFINKYPEFSRAAFLSSKPEGRDYPRLKLKLLNAVTKDFRQGLKRFDLDRDDIALISMSDFCYGPFEYDFDLGTEWKSKGTKSEDQGRNFIETGLMFHLAYLFRYFSVADRVEKPMHCFFSNDILVLDGVRMLKDGKPKHDLVAALTNAVFERKDSSDDVKDRLKNISKSNSKGSRRPPTFIGW